ncbi:MULTISPECIES: cell division regulator GpsB [Aerococcus]|uniref:Cell division regulator GpsB n=2 Tax=Aerococcus TaxID=1375 RepID=A0A2I1L8C5_9LACT|nr:MULTISPECIES: cell division regulator GpsB [Aerococcus]KAA9221164.1 cell division regulator GpsB [Aerococcus loyolae]KAA9264857.1 cell division regulator GpsB [Aerococcus loyolae]MCY3025465.1 cell division regulator GpsB [Aerococcus loyolae]MCY3026589.1 cell division regulator GpsB [Aerococcus loyolae]MCY3028303.1 cell division regulator GpsB [Aerococcus loyolae]
MSARNLTTKDILQKEFKPALRGFNTEEVDAFLDLIIRDYESYEKELAFLRQENNRLKQNIESESKQTNNTSRSSSQVATTNYDILKRLSKLEKTVYGQSIRKQNENYQEDPVEETRIYRSE